MTTTVILRWRRLGQTFLDCADDVDSILAYLCAINVHR